MMILCKNHPSLWAFQKIDKFLKPIVMESDNKDFKLSVIFLITKITRQFNWDTDAVILKNIEIWLRTLKDGK